MSGLQPLKLLLFLLPFAAVTPKLGSRKSVVNDTSSVVRIDFVNQAGVCQKSISAADIDSVDWGSQHYMVKKDVNLDHIDLFDGWINIYFHDALILKIVIQDVYSSRGPRHDIATTGSRKGNILEKDNGFYVMPPADTNEPMMKNYLSNHWYVGYLRSEKVAVSGTDMY